LEKCSKRLKFSGVVYLIPGNNILKVPKNPTWAEAAILKKPTPCWNVYVIAIAGEFIGIKV
jgi:hypothetical protein